MNNPLIIKELPPSNYEPIWEQMRNFTGGRSESTSDELWVLEHQPVFTQGQAGKAEHILNPHNIPVVQTDRGGQVTYHGPGQLMLYTLFDLNRLKIGTRTLVRRLEQIVIDLLASMGIKAAGRTDAPGVYVNDAKFCSIGLRVRQGYCYHGIALNVDMDLTPFSYINPCGFKDLTMTQMSDHVKMHIDEVKSKIIPYFIKAFGYCETDTHQ